ncbi:MAG TPA: hypothetical protein VNJ09_07795, partial [Chthonomonadales bacterium]|nr:hypothetical protein [Chthonomonadales bacterium]
MNPVDVRRQLVDALQLDLIGPRDGLGAPEEILPQAPSRWYLTGFLVPLDAGEHQRADEASTDELDEVSDAQGLDDAVPPEPTAARRAYMPSSIGVSLLVSATTTALTVIVRWGDYVLHAPAEGEEKPPVWERTPREETVSLALPDATPHAEEKAVPNSHGLCLALSVRGVPSGG